MIHNKMSIEKAEYSAFINRFSKGEFQEQRFGQAFFDYFKMEKMNNQELTNAIYYADDATAKQLISETFNFE